MIKDSDKIIKAIASLPTKCKWCNQNTKICGRLTFYSNKHYKGYYCSACIDLVDLAAEAIERDNS